MNTETKTHVATLPELYTLIPSCRALENKNFSDIKELLTNLITHIEYTKGWEFVQYINNKPSLFVVRYREPVKAPRPSYTQPIENSYRDNQIGHDTSVEKEYSVEVNMADEDSTIPNNVDGYTVHSLQPAKLPWEE